MTTDANADRKLLSISPFFIVRDLRASVAYHVDRLGFELAFEGPPDDIYYAGVSRDGLWGFEVGDADAYVIAFFHTRVA